MNSRTQLSCRSNERSYVSTSLSRAALQIRASMHVTGTDYVGFRLLVTALKPYSASSATCTAEDAVRPSELSVVPSFLLSDRPSFRQFVSSSFLTARPSFPPIVFRPSVRQFVSSSFLTARPSFPPIVFPPSVAQFVLPTVSHVNLSHGFYLKPYVM